jgi:Xaa-Pro aminopeptidase
MPSTHDPETRLNSPTVAPPAPAAHLPLVPAAELSRRARAIADRLTNAKLEGAFLLHPSSIFWISGTLGDAYPFVDADGHAYLPIRTSVGRASHESSLPNAAIRRPDDLPTALTNLGAHVGDRIGVELDVVPVATYRRLERTFPNTEFLDVSRIVREVRAVKSAYEIEWIERAGRIVAEAMDESLPPRIREGVTENELAAFFEGEMRRLGHQGVIRLRRWNLEMHFGMFSAGASASYPCYFDGPDGLEGLYPAVQQGGGARRIERGVPILTDYVGGAGGYLADRTRIFCVGEPPAAIREAHAFCLEMQREIVSRLRPGAIPSVIYEEVTALAEKSPWFDRFMGWGENRVKFLGHGVGLDLDEFPVIAPRFDQPLEPGHVLAVEPKVFLGEAGAAGVENTFVVTPDGSKNVTEGPDEIRIVEPERNA